MKTLKTILLKGNPKYDEKWLQNEIAQNPSMLGLGDIELRAKEKIQSSGGRLDLLLEDQDAGKRYECELQLGKTDESHIIRTIEYWDLERKRYPQYEHTAVLVAEDVESRFLNVVQLFNGHIPLIVLKMTAVEVDDDIAIIFTKVIDEARVANLEDEEVSEPTDRNYWEKRSCHDMLALTDRLEALVKEVDPEVRLNYVKHYIGLARHNSSANYCYFHPKKNFVLMHCKSIPEDSLIEELEGVGLDVEKLSKWNLTRVRMTKAPNGEQIQVLKKLVKFAMDAYGI